MSTMDVPSELKLTSLRKENLRKTFEEVESHSSSVLFLALQWKDMESHFDSVEKSISHRHDQLASLEDSLRKRHEEVKSREERIEPVQESVSRRFKEIESREANEKSVFEERAKELDLIRVSVEERSREVEVVQGMVEQGLNALDLKEKGFRILENLIDDRSKELEDVQKSVKESLREIELKERRLGLIEESVVECEKEIELREKRVEEWSKEIKLEEKQFEETVKEVELREKRILEWERAFDSKERRLEERSVEVELREKRILEWEKAFDSKERRLEERYVEVELREKRILEWERAFDSKERRLEERSVEVELKDKRVKERAKEIELKEVKFEECAKAFSLKEKRWEERYMEIELEHERIKERAEKLQLKEKIFDELRMKSLEERSKKTKMTPEIKTERSKPVDDDCCGKGGDLRFSVSMDGNGLQSFLNERVDEHERIGDEVLAAMRMSLDPARLVLDAVEGFYPLSSPRLRKGGKVFELGVVRRSCVLLLEQLIRTCPKIRPSVREAAKGVAVEWKGKMGVEELEVLGFLLLVGAYGLVPEFDKDEIEKFFWVVEKHRLASQLRHLLGITDNIADFKLQSENAPDILEKRITLLEKETEDRKCTEPTPASDAQSLMQSEVKHSRTVISAVDGQNAPASTSSIVHSSRPSISSTIHPIQPTTSSTIQPNQPSVIEHSQTVTLTADTQHLESEFPPKILEDRIAELENQKADTLKVLNSEPRCGPVTRLLFQQKSERCHTASATVTASPSPTNSPTPAPVHIHVPAPAPASEVQPQQQSGNKRHRTTESAETASNDSVGATSTIHSEQNPAKWNASSHMNHGVHYSTRCCSLNGFPPNNQNIGLYSNRPISYYPRPALRPVYYNKPVAYGGPCQALRQPGYYDHPMSFGGHGNGYKGPNHNGQAHSGALYDPFNP